MQTEKETTVEPGDWTSSGPSKVGPESGAPPAFLPPGIKDVGSDLVGQSRPPDDPLGRVWLDCSDAGNAARLVAQHGKGLAYVPDVGWLAWTGTHWSRDEGEKHARAAARATAIAVRDEVAACAAHCRDNPTDAQHKARDEELRKWAVTSGNAGRLAAMVELAQTDLWADHQSFDREPLALTVLNGVLRFETVTGVGVVQLDPHRAKDRLTRCAAAAFDPALVAMDEDGRRTAWANAAPLWAAHLERVLPDPDERAFFARVMGYAATGLTHEQKFFVFQGRGGDGKSTAVNALGRVLGGYAVAANVRTFLDQKFARDAASASPDIARLDGPHLVMVSEPKRGDRLDEGLLKLVTGGGKMTARHLSKCLFEFLLRFKLVIECNTKPGISGTDDGIWRRLEILPWRVQIPEAEFVRGLEDTIVKDEAAGVLAWLVGGVLDYLDAGLAAPESVREAKAAFRAESDDVGEWLRGCVERDPLAITAAKDLFNSYTAWCEINGVQAKTQTGFGRALSDMQIAAAPREPGTGRRRWAGVRLVLIPRPPDYGVDDGGSGFGYE